jgi:hypothetical protein
LLWRLKQELSFLCLAWLGLCARGVAFSCFIS